MMAAIIHEESAKRGGAFVKVDCSAIPESLIESELFGFEKGAFTGAYHSFQGKFEQAHQGTLFIDEIGNLNTAVQTKLLTVLEDFFFYRIGSDKSIKVDVRIITATNADLEDLIRRGKFRKDLFYRLNVLALSVPPLRDRLDDIPLLCESLFNGPFQKHVMKPERISPGIYDLFMKYHWPGNIRELENLLLKSLLFCNSRTLMPKDIVLPKDKPSPDQNRKGGIGPRKYNRRIPAEEIAAAVKACKGNITMAADKLGIARITIYRKLKNRS
jgi:transcriptional regulator with PAS, ATPase and Fis domain